MAWLWFFPTTFSWGAGIQTHVISKELNQPGTFWRILYPLSYRAAAIALKLEWLDAPSDSAAHLWLARLFFVQQKRVCRVNQVCLDSWCCLKSFVSFCFDKDFVFSEFFLPTETLARSSNKTKMEESCCRVSTSLQSRTKRNQLRAAKKLANLFLANSAIRPKKFHHI